MRKIIIVLAVLIVVCISCCKDRNSSAQLQSFPISIGNSWKYKYTNYIGLSDTMIMTVVSKEKNQFGDSVYVIQRLISSNSDTLFVLATKDSVNYYNDLALTSLSDKYLLPLSTGYKWSDRVYSLDSTMVEGIGQTRCSGILYDSIISVRRYASQGSDSIFVYLSFIKPGIGIIYQSQSEYIGYNDGYSICLLSYNIVK